MKLRIAKKICRRKLFYPYSKYIKALQRWQKYYHRQDIEAIIGKLKWEFEPIDETWVKLGIEWIKRHAPKLKV